MSWVRQLALAAVATLVALLLVEGAARWLGINPGYGRFIPLGDAPTRTVAGVTLWQDRAPRATADDVARAAADRQAFTIVGLGDSIMYGVGQAPDQTYLAEARRRLAGRTARPVEILNLAVPGYNTQQEDAVHQEIADRLPADLVLLHYGATTRACTARSAATSSASATCPPTGAWSCARCRCRRRSTTRCWCTRCSTRC
ncbi:MAG: SGNH/GDSL hydrolase family protein [Candidatus Binatia bacterium]